MAQVMMDGILVGEKDVKSVMTKSNLPVGGYSVNPYVGCTHACKYCYASFMKRFTGHSEEWGTFLDVKHWPEIKNPKKYAGQRVVIGSVTDGYNPQEEHFRNTRKLLEQLCGSGIANAVLRDVPLRASPCHKQGYHRAELLAGILEYRVVSKIQERYVATQRLGNQPCD